MKILKYIKEFREFKEIQGYYKGWTSVELEGTRYHISLLNLKKLKKKGVLTPLGSFENRRALARYTSLEEKIEHLEKALAVVSKERLIIR